MTDRVPEGWFVRPEADHHGNITIRVVKQVTAENEWAGTAKQLLPDGQVFHVPAETPWWAFWEPSFERRVQEAFDRAKRRAWTLNQHVDRAGRLTFRAGQPNHE